MKSIVAFSIALFCIAGCVTKPGLPYVPEEMVVGFKTAVSETQIMEINKAHGTVIKRVLSGNGTYLLGIVNGASVEDVVSAYQALPEVEFTEPNYILRIF